MKFRIDNHDLEDDFFNGARMIGIVASVKDYLFCWQLNQLLQMDFRVNNDLEIQLTKKGRDYFFSVYEYTEPNGSLVHYLYNNQFDGEYLLPEFRHLDFLWLLRGDIIGNDDLTNLQQSIKSLPAVQLVMELSTGKIKNKGHLIL